MPELHVPVLIAGGGTVGLSAALFLAHHGVPALAVERRGGLSIHPRALGIGPRTVEIFRQVGLEDPVLAVGGRLAGGRGRISVPTLAEADWASLSATAGGSDPGLPASPAQGGRCSQDLLDEILLAAARERGAEVRFGAEVIAVEQDAAGVTATLAGKPHPQTVRADYLIVADGAGGLLRESLGIPATSPEAGGLGTSIVNILFRADLRAITQGHEFFTCGLANSEIPMGLLMAIDGRERWVLHVPVDAARGETAEDFTPERCRELVRRGAIGALPGGTPEVAVEILSVLPWRVAARLADRFRAGRVFLAGDAAHVVPPTGGFGLNSGVADAHNLAWKLAWAFRSAGGEAGPALLDSYDAERRPVARFTLEQSLLRLARPDLHWDPSRTAEREALGIADDRVVHLGYRYDSPVVLGAEPLPSLYDLASDLDGAPGSRVPHAWLERDGRRVSTLDLGGSGFALLGGPAANGWCAGAESLGLPAFPIADPSGRWHLAAGVGDEGALLVRPDGFVAWRARNASPAEAGAVLAGALRAATGLEETPSPSAR